MSSERQSASDPPSGLDWARLVEGLGAAHAGRDAERCVEWCPICRGAELLRAGAPPELREGLQAVQREALLTMRALVDHYLERLGTETPGPRVEDIPIE